VRVNVEPRQIFPIRTQCRCTGTKGIGVNCTPAPCMGRAGELIARILSSVAQIGVRHDFLRSLRNLKATAIDGSDRDHNMVDFLDAWK
jgi:hypothetical protein